MSLFVGPSSSASMLSFEAASSDCIKTIAFVSCALCWPLLAVVPRCSSTTKRLPCRSKCILIADPGSPKMSFVASCNDVIFLPSTAMRVSPGNILPDEMAGAPGVRASTDSNMSAPNQPNTGTSFCIFISFRTMPTPAGGPVAITAFGSCNLTPALNC